MNQPLSFVVGQSAPQIEAQEKVSGSAQYIADLYRPNMLYGALLQSPHAHARIVGHDISQAAAMPGVHAIITGDDLQEHWRMGAFIKDEHALAKGRSATSASRWPPSPPRPNRWRAQPPPRLR